MKKLIYKIYGIIYGIILLIHIILLPLSIIIDIKYGLYGSLILTIIYLLSFNFSSIVLSKTKLRYHGKEVTEEIKLDLIKKIFIKRCLMFGMAICAIISLIYIVIYSL